MWKSKQIKPEKINNIWFKSWYGKVRLMLAPLNLWGDSKEMILQAKQW